MGLLSRLFSNKDDAPVVSTAANDSVPASAPAQPDNDYVQMPKELRDLIMKTRGFDPMPEPVHISKVLTSEQYAQHMEKRRAADEALNTFEPGQKMPDGTIYLGQYKPKDRDGKSLSKTFNVFAAPEDLPETMKYVDAVKHIAKLKGWNGYDGTNYATDKEFYAAVKSGSYNGGWIIPTRDILHGKDVDGKDTTPDNILAHKDKGAFKDKKHAFKMAASSGSVYPDWYWSSTEYRDDPSFVWVVRLSDGNDDWCRKDNIRLSCRPVRLVEVKMGG